MFLKNKDFFDRPPGTQNVPAQQGIQAQQPAALPETGGSPQSSAVLPAQDEQLAKEIGVLEAYSREAGRNDLLAQITSLREYLSCARFSTAVVGEFNRGKSTLVNRLIGLDIIPASALPTTTLPIRVTGDRQESLLWKTERGEKEYPLAQASWGAIQQEAKACRQQRAEILLKRNCSWLLENDLELIDTPGVNSRLRGDLEMAERILGGCDCAILTMAAVAAFSESEKTFLQERILMKKVPRIMVVLTKLDLLSGKDRASVVESVQRKLETFGAGIPLYLSADGLMPEWEARSGPAAIRRQLLLWLHESSHARLKKNRACQVLKDIASDLKAVYACQLEILAEKQETRKAAAEQKKSQLRRASHIRWDSLEIDMLTRCNQNFKWLRSITEERQQDVTEKLLVDLSHTGNPKEWWERDYPYRIKMEMISLGNTLENNLQNFYTRDVNWMNHLLEKRYGAAIPPQNQRIADKSVFRTPLAQKGTQMEDIRRSRIVSRIGTGAATIAGYLAFGLIGLSPVGMAIGIGGGVVSEIFMNRRVEAQKQKLSRLISENLPLVFSSSIETVEKNVREIYLSTIDAMKQSCTAWADAKCSAIDAAQAQSADPQREEKLCQKRDMLDAMIGRIVEETTPAANA